MIQFSRGVYSLLRGGGGGLWWIRGKWKILHQKESLIIYFPGKSIFPWKIIFPEKPIIFLETQLFTLKKINYIPWKNHLFSLKNQFILTENSFIFPEISLIFPEKSIYFPQKNQLFSLKNHWYSTIQRKTPQTKILRSAQTYLTSGGKIWF